MKRLLGGVSDLFATSALAGQSGSIHDLEDETDTVAEKPRAKVAQFPASQARARKRLTGGMPVVGVKDDLKYITHI